MSTSTSPTLRPTRSSDTTTQKSKSENSNFKSNYFLEIKISFCIFRSITSKEASSALKYTVSGLLGVQVETKRNKIIMPPA